jgi:lipopolysaccharide transport system ATP-binding protein
MSDAAVRIEALSKRYVIGRGSQEETFRDLLSRVFTPRRPEATRSEEREFWALRDITFDVRRGQVMGIVGRNGAGKSTLLKILSRITEPTSGRVEIRGRVTSLLEVGTGFHPELTGRENVYLNGAILGMSRREIRRRFDEIVSFAEVEDFIDTPVKRYSSGMYLRLAFAISAHLDPEIQIVDEVLAVGDAAFQRKCVAKIQSIASKEGATVLFVSHSVGTVQELCSAAAWLDKGRLRAVGAMAEVVDRYYKAIDAEDVTEEQQEQWLRANFGEMRVAVTPGSVVSGHGTTFTVTLRAGRPTELRDLALLIYSEYGARVAVLDLRPVVGGGRRIDRHPLEVSTVVEHLPLVEGTYSIGLYLGTDWLSRNFFGIASLEVEPALPRDGAAFEPYPAVHRGVMVLEHRVTRT